MKEKQIEVEPRIKRPLALGRRAFLLGAFHFNGILISGNTARWCLVIVNQASSHCRKIKEAKEMIDYLVSVMPQLLSGGRDHNQIVWINVNRIDSIRDHLGFILASRLRIWKAIVQVYVWLMRGTPLLLQLIFLCFMVCRS